MAGTSARVPDWPGRLAEFIEERRSAALVYGVQDCCLFAADWVERATGVDPAALLRGTYHNAAGAARILARNGGVTGLATAALGQPVPSALAQRGDLVLVDGDDGRPALAVVIGDRAVGPSRFGLRFVPVPLSGEAWRV